MLLYHRSRVKYRKDGYYWKKRRDGKTTREDHTKLKVHGLECIYGCYVHSAILPTFHRRSYWLLQVQCTLQVSNTVHRIHCFITVYYCVLPLEP